MKNSTPTLTQKMLIEAIGAFLLTFIGVGSILASSYIAAGGAPQLIVIALAHGLALAIAVTIAFNISGGHINPAVTIGMLVTKRISPNNALAYIIAQVIGASVAGFLIIMIMPTSIGAAVNWGTPTLASSISVYQGIAIEAVITFFLVFTVFGTAVDSRSPKMGGLLIGLALAAGIMFAGPFTGGAANPARAIGPAIASGDFANWYVYWIGPVIGGVIAALIYEYGILRNSKQ